MLAVLPIIFATAIEMERFTRGRGNELATQETIIWSVDTPSLVRSRGALRLLGLRVIPNRAASVDLHAETAPIGIRNIAKKRAPMFVVPVAIAFPTAATSIRQTM